MSCPPGKTRTTVQVSSASSGNNPPVYSTSSPGIGFFIRASEQIRTDVIPNRIPFSRTSMSEIGVHTPNGGICHAITEARLSGGCHAHFSPYRLRQQPRHESNVCRHGSGPCSSTSTGPSAISPIGSACFAPQRFWASNPAAHTTAITRTSLWHVCEPLQTHPQGARAIGGIRTHGPVLTKDVL